MRDSMGLSFNINSAEIIAQEQQMDSIKLKFTLQIRKHSITLHYGKAAMADLESFCLTKINSAKNQAPSGFTYHQMEALTPKTLYLMQYNCSVWRKYV